MWVRTEDEMLLNLAYVRAIKVEEDGESGLRLVAYGDESAYGGRASAVVVRRFPVGEGRTHEQAAEDASRSLDLLQSSFETIHQMAVVTPSHPVAFRTL